MQEFFGFSLPPAGRARRSENYRRPSIEAYSTAFRPNGRVVNSQGCKPLVSECVRFLSPDGAALAPLAINYRRFAAEMIGHSFFNRGLHAARPSLKLKYSAFWGASVFSCARSSSIVRSMQFLAARLGRIKPRRAATTAAPRSSCVFLGISPSIY